MGLLLKASLKYINGEPRTKESTTEAESETITNRELKSTQHARYFSHCLKSQKSKNELNIY